jgi:chaperone BCS1
LFSVPIYDLFEQSRVVITIVHSGEIHVCSKTLDVEGLKRYLKHVMILRLGVAKIIVHQPVIETFDYGKKVQESKSTRDDSSTTVKWTSFPVRTNKNFSNTILTDEVHAQLVEDLKNFAGAEDYYNIKGIPYKRGYLLYGPPGTGKTSIIKAMASYYGMDVYLINMGDVETEKEMSLLFQGTRSADGYHMLVFEDIDRCPMFQSNSNSYYGEDKKTKSLMRTFLNELDGVIETPKRITLLTANDENAIMKVAALCRPGRIDQQIKLGHCDAKQLCGLFNHFTDQDEKLEMKGELKQQVTPAQVVKYILQNTMITPKEFKTKIGIIAEIEVKERKLCESLNESPYGRRRKARSRRRAGGWNPVTRQRRVMNRRKRELKKLETDQAKYLDRHRTKREQVRKSEELLQKRIVTQQKRREREKIRKQKEREREKKRKAKERAKSRPAKKRKTKG